MSNDDMTPRFAVSDITAAIGLLTRLPVTVDHRAATARGAASAWAYPVAGLAVAFVTGIVGLIAIWLSVPAPIVAGIILGTQIVLTGAMHEDGLADCADGFWGGWDKARRLEIMKDSRIGTYGVLALGLSLLLRWTALTTLVANDHVWLALFVAAAVSRAPMVALMWMLENARGSGLSHGVGRPAREHAIAAAGIAALVALLLTGYGVFPLFIFVTLTTMACSAIASAKIGGQTGDVLGATQQLTEVAALVVMASIAG